MNDYSLWRDGKRSLIRMIIMLMIKLSCILLNLYFHLKTTKGTKLSFQPDTKRNFVSFNSSETTTVATIKLSIIEYLFRMTVKTGFVMQKSKIFLYNFYFLTEDNHVLLKHKPSPDLSTRENFVSLESKMTSQITLNCPICVLYFLKNYLS